MELTKVKAADINRIKAELIKKQLGKCPVTGRDLRAMTSANVVVDHNHQTGVIRGALPRGINGVEGKLLALLMRWGSCKNMREVIEMLKGFIAYWEYHATPQTPYIHPTHLTPTEKRNKQNADARKKAAAKLAGSVKK